MVPELLALSDRTDLCDSSPAGAGDRRNVVRLPLRDATASSSQAGVDGASAVRSRGTRRKPSGITWRCRSLRGRPDGMGASADARSAVDRSFLSHASRASYGDLDTRLGVPRLGALLPARVPPVSTIAPDARVWSRVLGAGKSCRRTLAEGGAGGRSSRQARPRSTLFLRAGIHGKTSDLSSGTAGLGTERRGEARLDKQPSDHLEHGPR